MRSTLYFSFVSSDVLPCTLPALSATVRIVNQFYFLVNKVVATQHKRILLKAYRAVDAEGTVFVVLFITQTGVLEKQTAMLFT